MEESLEFAPTSGLADFCPGQGAGGLPAPGSTPLSSWGLFSSPFLLTVRPCGECLLQGQSSEPAGEFSLSRGFLGSSSFSRNVYLQHLTRQFFNLECLCHYITGRK